MKGKRSILIGVVVLVVLILISAVSTYNKLNVLDENVNSSWAQVENVLKRRADLIPNLVNTVKGYANQEKEVLMGITEARSKFESSSTPAEYAQANSELNNALTKLYAVVENYPELKSNENFLELQYELSGTENRIATERRRYNDSVKEYNTTIRRFPTNIFANMFGFDKREYFEISPQDAEVPEVKF